MRVGEAARCVWELTAEPRRRHVHGVQRCPQAGPPGGARQAGACSSCTVLWWQTLEQLGLAVEADDRPEEISQRAWPTAVQRAFQDALRRWEQQEQRLATRPERTLRTAGYITGVVTDAVTRELLLKTHWEYRAHNEPAQHPLPAEKLAEQLQAARAELVAADYPRWSGRAFAQVRRQLSPFAAGLAAALPQHDPGDLAVLDRSAAQVRGELEAAIEALWQAGGAARRFVATNLLDLMSQRLTAHQPDEDEDGGDELARHADAGAAVEEVVLEGDELAAAREAVRRHCEDGEDVVEAARDAFRRRYGWAEGAQRAERVREQLQALAAEAVGDPAGQHDDGEAEV